MRSWAAESHSGGQALARQYGKRMQALTARRTAAGASKAQNTCVSFVQHAGYISFRAGALPNIDATSSGTTKYLEPLQRSLGLARPVRRPAHFLGLDLACQGRCSSD